MDIVHKTRTKVASQDGTGLFLLTNKRGGYFLLGDNGFSHFTGLFNFLPGEWTLFKSVADIRLDVAPTGIKNKMYAVQRYSGDALEEFIMFNKSLHYQVSEYQGGITIDLDMRRVYDEDDQGRIYKIYWEAGAIVVEYAKLPQHQQSFLIIRGADRFTLLNQWEPRQYAYDAARGGKAERWVYKALRIQCQGQRRLTFTLGLSKQQAMDESLAAWEDHDLPYKRLKQFAQSVKTTNGVAYSAAVFSLESLVTGLNGMVNRTGVFAGLPWFFQFWARDELVSLQGLVLAEKYSLVKDILLTYVSRLDEEGRLPNMYPPSSLGSADAVGWLWKRLGDYLSVLEKRKMLWEYWSVEELEWLADRLEGSLRSLQISHVRDDLVINAAQETWMDTHGGVGDVRSGARVEIQALTLSSLKTLRLLYRLLKRTNGKEFRTFEKRLMTKVRQAFFVDGMLLDGVGDATVRPNVFIAAYVYPELLSKKEWGGVFEKALRELWLEWGGLSSIGKSHPLFVDSYSGQDNRSYHRGDSWYWVNNIAALALHRIDGERFGFHVERLKRASVHELLWQGAIGHCAELSSARQQTSSGCLAQAWSAATLIELLDEVGE